jgi:tetraacyldisaccharide 4'-kinase
VRLSADAVGDEACMLARTLPGVPVVAGKDRVAAGMLAVTRFLPDMIIMDDGFQYHRLERSLDIVLINGRNPFGNGFLLPRGPLREPLSALRRAGVIMLTKTSAAGDSRQKLAASLRRYNAHAPLFSSQAHPGRLYDAHTLRDVPWEHMAGQRIVALCSIGDPESFFEMLAGLQPAALERLAFADHHIYGQADYALIKSRAEQADYLVTTEKDIAKIEMPMLQSQKLLVLGVELTIEHEEAFLKHVQQAAGIG